jgi:tetratricopeptide (TPR) repeat protein
MRISRIHANPITANSPNSYLVFHVCPVFNRFVAAAALLFFSLGCLATPSRSPSAEFDQANKLYEQGKFEEATIAYEALAAAGARTASVWFNLGNAAYKAGQLGRSIAAYRRAEQLTPRDAALRANLQFVRGKVYSDERTRVPMWKSVVRLVTLNEWTVLTAASAWAFFFVLACGEWLGRDYGKTAVVFLIVAAVCGSGLAAAWEDQHRANAVVITREVTARLGPLSESQAAFQLRDGAELSVLASKDNWLEVRDAEKRTGWIRRDEVIVLGSSRGV